MGTGTSSWGPRAEGSLGPPPVLASVNLVPLLWTGVPTPSASGGPTRSSGPTVSVFGAPATLFHAAGWVFPDHLITYLVTLLVSIRVFALGV